MVGTVRHGTQGQLKKLGTCEFDNTGCRYNGVSGEGFWTIRGKGLIIEGKAVDFENVITTYYPTFTNCIELAD
ncbi:7212_t:CDS:2 [Diversispora eburnea]|uniref:7212_t:CDS:1 n=1 Tax=Diversispora eburnea TaxID=1213867 RepID=A0A9N8VAW4_9GLOM|nr:7212_t:CDS:2 [Diversispora eburnea]